MGESRPFENRFFLFIICSDPGNGEVHQAGDEDQREQGAEKQTKQDDHADAPVDFGSRAGDHHQRHQPEQAGESAHKNWTNTDS